MSLSNRFDFVTTWLLFGTMLLSCAAPGNRWITISGGQAALIKKAIEDGMLGAAEAHKIMADTDHEKTGGMYLCINQFGEQCTVDASVAKYARAKSTWRSGHYFYEPLRLRR